MGSLSIWHWLIVLAIVVLVFGTGKLKNMGKDLGGAIKGFKEGMNEGDKGAAAKTAEAPKQVAEEKTEAAKTAAADVVEGKATEKKDAFFLRSDTDVSGMLPECVFRQASPFRVFVSLRKHPNV